MEVEAEMKGKILCIDDVEGIRVSFGMVFKSRGYQYLSARDGMEGLEMLKKDGFDAILLDMSMPGMNGIDFLKRLRDLPEYNRIPVIVVSAMEDERLKAEALALGAREFLVKPVQPKGLVGAVAKAISCKAV